MSQPSAAQPPHASVTIHMMTSLDGKAKGEFMADINSKMFHEYYRIDRDVLRSKTPVVMLGRNTMQGYAPFEDPKNFPASDKKGDRSDFHADLATNPAPADKRYIGVLDPHGRLAWKTGVLMSPYYPYYNGDHVIEVLAEDLVSDDYLAHLRKVNVPYIFAGKSALDFRLAADKLAKLFHTDCVVSHGGGTVNGGFLEQGVVDHLSLVLAPAVSGDPEAVSVFNPVGGKKLPLTNFTLDSVEKLPEGCIWLRYSHKA